MKPAADRRAFLVVLDSVGIGGAPDAARFGDEGANTVGHIAEACARGRADAAGRAGPLHLPNMAALGLGRALAAASDHPGPLPDVPLRGSWAAATEQSAGKDTPTGHWELAGVPVPWRWHVFPDTVPALPEGITRRIADLAGTDGVLGDCHASGTEIIARLGAEHMRTGRPIVYTSADSVIQIAAHEESFGLARLLDLCARLAPMAHEIKVGRVIARPFTGTPESGFHRTGNRRDFAIAPPAPTLLDRALAAGRTTHAVGKIGDIFAHRGIAHEHKAPGRGDAGLFAILLDLARKAAPGSLVFANLVEFDSEFGHRRDVAGYARHLEWFDAALPALLARLGPGDLLVITADHGNDPTWRGSDHTRERTPVLIHGAGRADLGLCRFVDVDATVAAWLAVPPGPHGTDLLG